MKGKLREGRLVSEWEKKRKRFFGKKGHKDRGDVNRETQKIYYYYNKLLRL